MHQAWKDLLFAHWPVQPEALAPLPLDLYEGRAWITVVPFWMSEVHLRGLPPHWLTERYCLYARDRSGQVWRGEIHHEPWPLQPVGAEIEVNSVAEAAGVDLPDRPPLLHFARRLAVRIWPLQRA